MNVNQGIKNEGNFFEIPALLSCENEEIQIGKNQNNIHILNFPTPFSAEFYHSQDKRPGISKKIVSFSTHFLHTLVKTFQLPMH